MVSCRTGVKPRQSGIRVSVSTAAPQREKAQGKSRSYGWWIGRGGWTAMSTSLHVRFGWRLRAAQGQRLTFTPRVSQGAGHSGGLMLFPGTAVVSSCSRGQRWSHPVPGTVVVSCCSRGQCWYHALPGTVGVSCCSWHSGGLTLFLAQWWYHPVLLDVIRGGAAALVQHSVWRVGSGWGWTWAHVWPHHWPHAGPRAWTFPSVRMIIPSLQDGSEKAALNLNIKDLKIVASDPITSWQIGKKWKQWQIFFSWAPKSLATVSSAMKLKDACSLEGKLWQT